MKAVIVCGGKAPSKKLLEKEINEDTVVICADSGADCLYEYNINPQYLIGDFDSINQKVLKYYKSISVITEEYPVEKDDTDSEIALNKALELGASEVVFLGCTGSRIDHIFGNIGLLKRCLDANIKGSIKDDNNNIFLINKSSRLFEKQGVSFSIQSYSGIVKKLNIRGAKYPLYNYDLEVGDPITISNMFLNEPVDIEFDEGVLIIFYTKD